MIYVGINDLIELVDKDSIKHVTIHDIMARYLKLHHVIRTRNRHAIIIVSAIMPHADSFDLYFPFIFGLNFALEKWCAKSAGKRVYVASYKRFLKGGRPKLEQLPISAQPETHVIDGFLQMGMSRHFILEHVGSRRVRKLALLPY